MPVFKFNVVKGNITSKLQSPALARLQKCGESGYSQKGLDFAVMSDKTKRPKQKQKLQMTLKRRRDKETSLE